MQSWPVILILVVGLFGAEGQTRLRELRQHSHAQVSRHGHIEHESSSRDTLTSAWQTAQTMFNSLVDTAEDIAEQLQNERAAILQVRTAFAACPMCLYTGNKLKAFQETFSVDTLVDRRYLMESIFPALLSNKQHKSILWVGVRPYSMRYEYIFAEAGWTFTTIEPTPDVALYGSTQSHIVDIAQNIDKYVPKNTFDVVICNGVLGWGIDSKDQIQEFYTKTDKVMKPGGILLVGYNAHIGSEHTCCTSPYFRKTTVAGLPQKQVFSEEWKHTYELYEKL